MSFLDVSQDTSSLFSSISFITFVFFFGFLWTRSRRRYPSYILCYAQTFVYYCVYRVIRYTIFPSEYIFSTAHTSAVVVFLLLIMPMHIIPSLFSFLVMKRSDFLSSFDGERKIEEEVVV